jgi:hypothetical protein
MTSSAGQSCPCRSQGGARCPGRQGSPDRDRGRGRHCLARLCQFGVAGIVEGRSGAARLLEPSIEIASRYRPFPQSRSAGMSAVLARLEITRRRPHWLAGAPGFEPRKSRCGRCLAETYEEGPRPREACWQSHAGKTNAIGALLGRKEQPDNGVISRRGVDPPRQLSRKLLSTLDRLGCLSFRNVFASI